MTQRLRPSLWPDAIHICRPGEGAYGRSKIEFGTDDIPVCAVGHLRHEFGLRPDSGDNSYNEQKDEQKYTGQLQIWEDRYLQIAEANGIDTGCSVEEVNDNLQSSKRRRLYLATWLSFGYNIQEEPVRKMYLNWIKNK